MNISTILDLVKDIVGIRTSTVRDTYITAIINGIIKELAEEQGLAIDLANPYHFMFITDYAVWRYNNRDSEGMPRNLKFRLNNLLIHVGTKKMQVNEILLVDVLPTNPINNIVYILHDGSKHMKINDTWANVNLTNGIWKVI